MYVTSLVFLPDSYSKLLYSIQLPKVTSNSTYLKLKANSLPFSSLTNLLLIQHHITTSTSTSARTWTSTPASGLLYCLTPSLPHILQVLWAQIFFEAAKQPMPSLWPPPAAYFHQRSSPILHKVNQMLFSCYSV